MLVFDFLSNDGDRSITVSFTIQKSGAKKYYNTENSEIKSVVFKNGEAFTWQTENTTHFIWVQDNIECQMFGDLDYNELIKIAENVEF